MMTSTNKLLNLFVHFMFLSLLAIGGASSTLSELHHYLVDSENWMTSTQFFDLYAISQASPGPNVQFVALFGWQVASWFGGFVSLLGMCGPSSILAVIFEHTSNLYRNAKWPIILRQGITPISIGLLFTNGWIIANHADGLSIKLLFLTLITVLLSTITRIHPLILIILGAIGGAAFL